VQFALSGTRLSSWADLDALNTYGVHTADSKVGILILASYCLLVVIVGGRVFAVSSLFAVETSTCIFLVLLLMVMFVLA
jgi:hypothetical protein